MEQLQPSPWSTQCSAPRSLFPLNTPQEPDDANFETPGSLFCVLSWLGYYTEPTWEDCLVGPGWFPPDFVPWDLDILSVFLLQCGLCVTRTVSWAHHSSTETIILWHAST